MAQPFAVTSAKIQIDSVDVSDWISNVSIESSTNPVDVTSMGNIGRKFVPGLKEDRLTMTGFADFLTGGGTSGLNGLLRTKYMSGGTFAISVWPNQNGAGTSTGTSNPCHSCSAYLFTFNSFSGNIGDAATTPLEFRAIGTISIATA